MKYLRRTLRLSLLGVAGLSSLLACNALFGIDPPVRVDDLDGRGGANGEDGCLLPSDCVEQGENYVCLFRVCSPPCVDDLDCTTSLGQGHRCLDTDEGAACVSTAQASCSAAGSSCPEGTACLDGECWKECEEEEECEPFGQICEDGACRTKPSSAGDPCTTDGEVTCAEQASEERLICTDGSWEEHDSCDGGELCTLASSPPGQCAVCSPNQEFCSGDEVRRCAADGLSSTVEETCGADQYCDAASAECVDGVCAPDAPACDENVARWCNADGTGYEAGGENCGSSATCDAGECKPHVCAPGALYCQTQQVRQCAENGLSSAVEQSCGGSTPLCLESDDTAFCAVCEPGQTQCSGNGLQTCDSSGQYGAAVPCEDQTCLGPSGSASCQGECAPMQTQCSGNGVQICNAATGEYGSTVTACTSTAPHCSAGVCGQPPSCQGLTANCGASNESCCASRSVTGGEEYNRINDASYPATVSNFRLDRYEVTVGRWRQFVAAWNAGGRPGAGAGKHDYLVGGGLENSFDIGTYESGWNSSWDSNVDMSDGARQVGSAAATWTTSPEDDENRPINYVNWYEAYAFCIWDGGFLPSEAEWNYAAAGGTAQRLYPWGTTSPTCALANFFGGSGATDYCYSSFTIGVGVLGGNGSYGQSDLAGNVQEWTLDSHAVAATAFFEPCDDCAYLSSTPTSRVTRGGMFSSVASALTTTSRLGTSHTTRNASVGLRCARAP